MQNKIQIDFNEIKESLIQRSKLNREGKEIGVVSELDYSVAEVVGLDGAFYNELVEFENGIKGQVLNLTANSASVVIFGQYEKIKRGDEVRRLHKILSIPVSDNYLGRVVNSVGEPIDALGQIDSSETRELELQAPSVMKRRSVYQNLCTGVKVIDSFTPIGLGQRQLLIGDRKTGKSTVAISAILNQLENWKSGDKKKQIRCIYVAIGQKKSNIASTVNFLREKGAMEYTTVFATFASDSPGEKYITPYSASALGQHWMYNSHNVLIVFDDLTKHADAYRTLSLLLRRSPGREAFPGDIFYLHSRLLERCAKLSDEFGGGSLTGLPIIETKEGDISAYIPTNVISITDGQCFFETDLFNKGIRPSVNVASSVSRVGGAAQTPILKSISGPLRLAMAQYKELESFAAFGSDLDESLRRQLTYGNRLVEILKQDEAELYSQEEEAVQIWLVAANKIDDVPIEQLRSFVVGFVAFLREQKWLESLQESKVELNLKNSKLQSYLEEKVVEYREKRGDE
jgi:F-type H+-transporting ATPase subunit alpha